MPDANETAYRVVQTPRTADETRQFDQLVAAGYDRYEAWQSIGDAEREELVVEALTRIGPARATAIGTEVLAPITYPSTRVKGVLARLRRSGRISQAAGFYTVEGQRNRKAG